MMWLLRVLSLIVLIGLGLVGHELYQRQVTGIIEQRSRDVAEAWRKSFERQVPDYERLVQRGTITPEQSERLKTLAASIGDVFRLKLFNSAGKLTAIYDLRRAQIEITTDMGKADPNAVALLSEGSGYSFTILDGEGRLGRPAHYAEIYMPLDLGAGETGVIEAYVDVTRLTQTTRAAMQRFAFAVLALVALVLTIPTVSWFVAQRAARRNARELKRTLREQKDLAEEMRIMGELSEWLQSSRSQQELFGLAIEFLRKLIPESSGEIYVYSNSRDVLDGSGDWGGAKRHDHIAPTACWSLRRGRTYAYGDSDLSFPCDHVHDEKIGHYLCMPLVAHGETVGLLHIRKREDADLEQFKARRRLAQICAEQLSMAIANVRLRDELQDQSIRDALTGLYNRRHLHEMLRLILGRATQEGGEVAILSIDVDHFKKFNDNYGHDAGDLVLRAVGDVLDSVTEGNELACRPGGEEFMVVLPDCSTPDALERAEEIRERVQAISVNYSGKRLPSISVSIGIAMAPEDGRFAQELIRSADEALYAAKAQGRNRVVLRALMHQPGSPEKGAAGKEPPRLEAAE